jgi:hypothetical protein
VVVLCYQSTAQPHCVTPASQPCHVPCHPTPCVLRVGVVSCGPAALLLHSPINGRATQSRVCLLLLCHPIPCVPPAAVPPNPVCASCCCAGCAAGRQPLWLYGLTLGGLYALVYLLRCVYVETHKSDTGVAMGRGGCGHSQHQQQQQR